MHNEVLFIEIRSQVPTSSLFTLGLLNIGRLKVLGSTSSLAFKYFSINFLSSSKTK